MQGRLSRFKPQGCRSTTDVLSRSLPQHHFLLLLPVTDEMRHWPGRVDMLATGCFLQQKGQEARSSVVVFGVCEAIRAIQVCCTLLTLKAALEVPASLSVSPQGRVALHRLTASPGWVREAVSSAASATRCPLQTDVMKSVGEDGQPGTVVLRNFHDNSPDWNAHTSASRMGLYESVHTRSLSDPYFSVSLTPQSPEWQARGGASCRMPVRLLARVVTHEESDCAPSLMCRVF